MTSTTSKIKRLSRAVFMFLLLLPESGPSQDVMTREGLMRRGIPPSKIATNVSAPVIAKPNVATLPPIAKQIEPVSNQPSPVPAANPLPPSFKLVETTATNAMDALDDKYRLAIGDRLSFRIVEDQEDPRPLWVTDSGDLELPYLGRYPAIGKTCKELALALKVLLEKDYYYRATVVVAVDLMTRSRGKIYLVGPVRAPGPQEIPSDEVLTLSKAILRAGGFTDFANKRTVKVMRKAQLGIKDQTFTVNVEEILEKGRQDADLPLQPGDLIYIRERMIRF